MNGNINMIYLPEKLDRYILCMVYSHPLDCDDLRGSLQVETNY